MHHMICACIHYADNNIYYASVHKLVLQRVKDRGTKGVPDLN